MEENKNNSFEEFKIIVNELLNLPDEKERDYELRVQELAALRGNNEGFIDTLKKLIDMPEDSGRLKSNAYADIKDKISFGAFSVYFFYLRMNEMFDEEKEVIETHERFREKHCYFLQIYTMWLLHQSIENYYYKLIKCAVENAANMPNNASAQHLLAIVVAEILEEAEYKDEINVQGTWFKAGKEASIEALNMSPDESEFHCTRGRIYALESDYGNAKYEINKAISIEGSDCAGYSKRISEYKMFLDKIEIRRLRKESYKRIDDAVDDSKKEHSKMYKEFKNMQLKCLVFLGIFTALISFVIGGINGSDALHNIETESISGIILVLMGSMMSVLSASEYIIQKGSNKGLFRNILVFAVGCAGVYIGLRLCLL